MSFFKSTYNILGKVDEDEVFNEHWMDSEKTIAPPTKKWSYDREMQIEDVDIWEVLYERGVGVGVYAAWAPYAEFYMITTGGDFRNKPRIINVFPYSHHLIETYYGPSAQRQVFQRAKTLGIELSLNQVWVDADDVWLYSTPEKTKKIILPSSNF
jgi:hypothetical protein